MKLDTYNKVLNNFNKLNIKEIVSRKETKMKTKRGANDNNSDVHKKQKLNNDNLIDLNNDDKISEVISTHADNTEEVFNLENDDYQSEIEIMTQSNDSNTTNSTELNNDDLDNIKSLTQLDDNTVHEQHKVHVEMKKKGEVKTLSYNFSDQGPYVVFIDTLKIPVKSNGLDDVRIGKLMKMKKLNEYIIDMRKSGKHRMKITFSNRDKANTLINDNNLITHNLKAFLPVQFMQRIGILKNIDTEMSDEELLENTVCSENIKIKDICRFMKIKKDEENKDIRIPLSTIKITFSGQILPDEVVIYGVKRKINQYLFTVTQCFQCYKFGHTKKKCKNGKKNCRNCGGEKHTDKDEDCVKEAKCINCKQSHSSTFKNCREFVRQSAIKKIMSLDNLSYWEANDKFPKVENSYNILEHAEEFPDLPEMFKNKNKNVNLELKKTYNMYHWYKETSVKKPSKVWNEKRHFSLPKEDGFDEYQPITTNPHKTNEMERLVSEVIGIQSRLDNFCSEETISMNPGILDGLLIDIGVYLKKSKEVLATRKNGEPTVSPK